MDLRTIFNKFDFCPKCGRDSCKLTGHGYKYDADLPDNKGSVPKILSAHIVQYCCIDEYKINYPWKVEQGIWDKGQLCTDCQNELGLE